MDSILRNGVAEPIGARLNPRLGIRRSEGLGIFRVRPDGSAREPQTIGSTLVPRFDPTHQNGAPFV
jgi:hypothetical protein